MALAIYRETSPGIYEKISKVGEVLDKFPIISTHDGETGDSVEFKLYVKSDDYKVYYTSITAYPENLTSTNYINGTSTGWGIKMRIGSLQPTQAEWENISYASTISIPNIGTAPTVDTSGSGDTNTAEPFWIRIECPANSPVRDKEATSITLSYTENLIETAHWI